MLSYSFVSAKFPTKLLTISNNLKREIWNWRDKIPPPNPSPISKIIQIGSLHLNKLVVFTTISTTGRGNLGQTLAKSTTLYANYTSKLK